MIYVDYGLLQRDGEFWFQFGQLMRHLVGTTLDGEPTTLQEKLDPEQVAITNEGRNHADEGRNHADEGRNHADEGRNHAVRSSTLTGRAL